MAWEKITPGNIEQIQKGDKVATGLPASIVHADSKSRDNEIEQADIKIFIVDEIAVDEKPVKLAKTIWSFSQHEQQTITKAALLEKWWWKNPLDHAINQS